MLTPPVQQLQEVRIPTLDPQILRNEYCEHPALCMRLPAGQEQEVKSRKHFGDDTLQFQSLDTGALDHNIAVVHPSW